MNKKKYLTLQSQSEKGTVCTIKVEDDRVGWMRGLVNGLQNRLHPFESGTDLKMMKETRVYLSSPSVFFRRVWCAFSWLMMPAAIYDDIVNNLRGYRQQLARISSTICEDIVNDLRGYRQRPVRISSTACEDIVVFLHVSVCASKMWRMYFCMSAHNTSLYRCVRTGCRCPTSARHRPVHSAVQPRRCPGLQYR